MTSTVHLRSPVPWMGGKYAMAPFLLEIFPPKDAYDRYCELFMGGCHVIAQKPPWNHYEVINDVNGDLVNFWMHLRDSPKKLARRLDSLPYAREIHYSYHKSLYDGTKLSERERAARWFYVLQSSFASHLKASSPAGWKNGPRSPGHGQPHAFRSALQLFEAVSQRFRCVEIDNRDFEPVLRQHQSPRTLYYVDPPYLGVEDYYRTRNGTFTLADHERLAVLLNETPAFVVLSYYEHPLLEQWYPAPKWRRVRWETVKHSQRTKATHERVTELVLCNYPPFVTPIPLWDEQHEPIC